MDFESKVAIVLGTSSGLGFSSAVSLLEKGYLVFGGSRSESTIVNDNFFEFEVDLTIENQIKNFIIEVKAETEVVDIVVNAVGMCEMNSAGDTSARDLRMHYETNVIGHFNFMKYFEPLIIAGDTHIINIFSISAKRYFPNTIAYSAAEFAKKAMLGVLEKEWKKYEVRFTNMYIGAVDTPLWDDYPEVERSAMLDISDYSYMFNMVVDAPDSIQFPELTFLHRDGFLD